MGKKIENPPAFTNGPWKIVANSWQYTTIYAADDTPICTLDLEDWDVTEENQEALELEQARVAHLIAAAPDFAEACMGDDVPHLWRLSWLNDLLSEIEEGTFGRIGEDEDPSATMEMVYEVKCLAKNLRAALSKARGEADV